MGEHWEFTAEERAQSRRKELEDIQKRIIAFRMGCGEGENQLARHVDDAGISITIAKKYLEGYQG